MKIPAHGTLSRYNNQKCRCSLCKEANREYHQKYTAPEITTSPHGTQSRYANQKCRCPLCVDANNRDSWKYIKERSKRDPTFKQKRRESSEAAFHRRRERSIRSKDCQTT